MPRKYPWPCSKIDRDLMNELHCESKKIGGVPISEIIAEAISIYLNARLDEKTAAVSAPPAQTAQAA